ncbi:MAG: flagellar type III secretion system protein FliQ [Planctomycetes bacterium]|nr:flagellar type III secretion system protein FliQ [Planctomycetota bacterium]
MNPTLVVDLGRELLLLALLVSLPMLATAIAVGLLIAIIQTVTAVHEQTLASVPKMIAVLAVALLVMPWSMGKLVNYTQHLLRELPRYASAR